MAEHFHYQSPDQAGWYLRRLRDADIYFDDSFILENLFSGERIQECDETVFLEDEEGEVLALAIISKTSPCVWSYYTIPKHRGKGCGYRLLVRCLERILEVMPDPETQIIIEPTSDGSEKHIAMLPDSLRARLMVRKC